MDNLSAHKEVRVRKLLEDRGFGLLYLSPYSPDFNPIEEAFSTVKRFLCMVGVQTRDVLLEAKGRALAAISVKVAKGFFARRGYHILE